MDIWVASTLGFMNKAAMNIQMLGAGLLDCIVWYIKVYKNGSWLSKFIAKTWWAHEEWKLLFLYKIDYVLRWSDVHS